MKSFTLLGKLTNPSEETKYAPDPTDKCTNNDISANLAFFGNKNNLLKLVKKILNVSLCKIIAFPTQEQPQAYLCICRGRSRSSGKHLARFCLPQSLDTCCRRFLLQFYLPLSSLRHMLCETLSQYYDQLLQLRTIRHNSKSLRQLWSH
jgi:hypothetical protein